MKLFKYILLIWLGVVFYYSIMTPLEGTISQVKKSSEVTYDEKTKSYTAAKYVPLGIDNSKLSKIKDTLDYVIINYRTDTAKYFFKSVNENLILPDNIKSFSVDLAYDKINNTFIAAITYDIEHLKEITSVQPVMQHGEYNFEKTELLKLSLLELTKTGDTAGYTYYDYEPDSSKYTLLVKKGTFEKPDSTNLFILNTAYEKSKDRFICNNLVAVLKNNVVTQAGIDSLKKITAGKFNTETKYYEFDDYATVLIYRNNLQPYSNPIYTEIGYLYQPGSNIISISKANYEEAAASQKFIIKAAYNHNDGTFITGQVTAVNPKFTFAYVLALGERARILFFHVPTAWISVLAFLLSMIYSILYLRKRQILYDYKASAAAGLGLMFCILATVTGAIWAKFNWGAFWNWDPRQTSIFMLLLIYGAYFALRSAVESEETRAKLSSVYSILSFITVPFFIFILPRIVESLHPDPIVNTEGKIKMDTGMLILFLSSLAGYTALFFWMLKLKIGLAKARIKMYKEKTDG